MTSEGRERLRLQLERDEGTQIRNGRHVIYDDSVGVPTVGYGRNLRDKGLSQREADYLLDNDIRDARAGVVARLPWAIGLPEARLAVLINMAFNLGLAGLLSFKKTLAAVQQGDYETAGLEMLDSKWRRQVGVRAERLALQMRSGAWA